MGSKGVEERWPPNFYTCHNDHEGVEGKYPGCKKGAL